MLETSYETKTDTVNSLVSRVMRIESVTWGDPKHSYLARYQGELYGDSAEAYDRLSQSLKPLDVTPLFRMENGRHTIILAPGVLKVRPAKTWIPVVLFILTLLSVMLAGTWYAYDGPVSTDPSQMAIYLFNSLGRGLSFAASLLSILLAHEFGHYLAGRFHKTHVTLPYFLPFPFSPFGTMGAFIQLKEPPKNKRILLDIGLAGPLAGLVVAIPVLLLGLSLSTVDRIALQPGQGISIEGNSILYLFAKFAVFGQLLPTPASYGGLSPAIYWLRYFFTGLPIPLGGVDVLLHPVAWAGWAGLLVTALNLIPAGQLDGGHLIYTLFGKRAQLLLPFILTGLVFLGLVWSGWWLWAILIFMLGRLHAEPLDQITPLDPPRKAMALLGLVIFILVFTPVPLRAFFG